MTVVVVVVGSVLGGDGLAMAGLGLLAGPVYSAARIGTALIGNPVQHRYLMEWSDLSSRLEPMPEAGREPQPSDRQLSGIGLSPLTRLGVKDGAATTVAFEVYRSPSKLVLVTVEAESGLAMALSRMTDDRVLVTCTDFVPPGVEVILNTAPPSGDGGANALADLVMHHVTKLDELKELGLLAAPAGPELVAAQVRLEWRAWQFLGPFIGPLISVDGRFLPHLLRVRPPRQQLWDRGLTTETRSYIRYRFRGPTPPGGPVGRTPEITVDVPSRPLEPRTAEQATADASDRQRRRIAKLARSRSGR
jgi:hypothetical protein